MIKVILFDFAGVIGSESYFGWLKKNIPNFNNRRSEFQKIADKGDMGEVNVEEFFALIKEVTGIPSDSIWKEIYEPVTIDAELISLIHELKKKYIVVLFSNYHGELLRKLLKKHGINNLFNYVFVSSEQGAKKPDEEAFLKILEKVKVHKKDVLFIDDRLENVEAGNKIGIDSILFTDVKKLKEEFQRRGL
jgi:FMN phosphatase YigB (HAD superfamily)